MNVTKYKRRIEKTNRQKDNNLTQGNFCNISLTSWMPLYIHNHFKQQVLKSDCCPVFI